MIYNRNNAAGSVVYDVEGRQRIDLIEIRDLVGSPIAQQIMRLPTGQVFQPVGGDRHCVCRSWTADSKTLEFCAELEVVDSP